MTIKAIETVYNGYRFRSRLEARWVVFFDTLGIRYEYEPEGYDLGEAGWYLPDFWLPDFQAWLEVKGVSPSVEEQEKCAALFQGSDYAALMGIGEPCYGSLMLYCNDTNNSGGGEGWWKKCRWTKHSDDVRHPDFPDPTYIAVAVHRPDTCLLDGNWESLKYIIPQVFLVEVHWLIWKAAEAARQARFEHGESG